MNEGERRGEDYAHSIVIHRSDVTSSRWMRTGCLLYGLTPTSLAAPCHGAGYSATRQMTAERYAKSCALEASRSCFTITVASAQAAAWPRAR